MHDAETVDLREAAPRGQAEKPIAAPSPVRGRYCNQCGWENPPESRFCGQCGVRLQELADAAAPVTTPAAEAFTSPPVPSSPSAVNRQVGLLVGAGVLLVMALYLVTVFSKGLRSGAGSEPALAAAPNLTEEQAAPPLPAGMQAQVEALEAEVEQLEGAARLEKQRALVNLFIGAGRADRAALVQEAVAEAEGTAEAWKRAGDLYYDWMDSLEGARKSEAARKAIAAYQRVLDQNPDNLDVRTDMAVAYLYDPEHPMEAIRQTNLVLEKDPNHIQANFNRGIMLMQINRLDQAVAQFERVKQLVGESSPIFQRAESVIQTIRSKQAGQGGM